MAGTTTNYAFPYHEATDPPDGASGLQDLAEAVDAALDGVEDTLNALDTTVDAIEVRLADIEDKTEEKPLVRLVAQSSQALADNTAVAIAFGTSSEEIDTHNFHSESTNNTRVTPTVAGYYRVNGAVFFAAQATPSISGAWIRKNGSTNMPSAGRYNGYTQAFSLAASVIVALNGSTDYVELVALQDSAGADDTNASSQFSSTLELEYIRPL